MNIFLDRHRVHRQRPDEALPDPEHDAAGQAEAVLRVRQLPDARRVAVAVAGVGSEGRGPLGVARAQGGRRDRRLGQRNLFEVKVATIICLYKGRSIQVDTKIACKLRGQGHIS